MGPFDVVQSQVKESDFFPRRKSAIISSK